MVVAVKKWGNSLAVRIPKDIAKSLSIEDNTNLEIKVIDNQMVLKPKKDNYLEELVSKIDNSNLHNEIETNRVGNEEW
jgi:antitoxin MazE